MRTIRISKAEFDAKKIVETDEELIVKDVVLTRESILPFADGKGFRSAQELKAAAWTLEGAWIVALGHIDTVFVTDPKDIQGKVENVRFCDKINGILGDAHLSKAKSEKDFIDGVKNGKYKDVSVAYFSEDVFTPGKFGDEPYDFVQQKFMFGHVAAGVPEGRCPSPFCGMSVDSLLVKLHKDPEETENYIHIPIRDKTLFTEWMRTITLSEKEGILAVIGKLKSDPGGKPVFQKYLFAKDKGWTMEKAQAWVNQHKNDRMDAEWTTEYVNNLPDECFAYIEEGGKKDDEGKTVPRSLRHLEFKNAQGEIEHDHLVAALQSLSGARTGKPLPYAEKAKPKLCAAVRSWNREHPDSKIDSEVCGSEDSTEIPCPCRELERSRRLLSQ